MMADESVLDILKEIDRKLDLLLSSQACNKPPVGWRCSLPKGHPGPCAASPIESYKGAEDVPIGKLYDGPTCGKQSLRGEKCLLPYGHRGECAGSEELGPSSPG